MTCEKVKFADTVAFMCSRSHRGSRKPCQFCASPHTKLCDFPIETHPTVSGGVLVIKTCDRRICELHAKSVGEDRDHCPIHAKEKVPA